MLTSVLNFSVPARRSVAYMAWIALAGLAVNATWNKPWADPVAALALTPLIMREAWEAIHHLEWAAPAQKHNSGKVLEVAVDGAG